MIIIGMILLVSLPILISDYNIKKNFCINNPNSQWISASDYDTYGNWLIHGNGRINITEQMDCKKYVDD